MGYDILLYINHYEFLDLFYILLFITNDILNNGSKMVSHLEVRSKEIDKMLRYKKLSILGNNLLIKRVITNLVAFVFMLAMLVEI